MQEKSEKNLFLNFMKISRSVLRKNNGVDFLKSCSPNPIINSETKNSDFHEFRIRIGTSLFVIAIFVKNIHIGKKIHGFRIGCWIQ